MPEIELSAGTIQYQDSGGEGPVIVLLHGLLSDATLWRNVVADLRDEYRCVLPTLPLGSHRRAMRPDADLSLHGQASLVAELLERLDLHEVTLVMNDWGGAQLLLAEGRDERIGRVALCACEAFDNFPPGLPGRLAGISAKLPGGIYLVGLTLRLRPLRRSPTAFGWMSKRPVPGAVMDDWLRPIQTQRAIRRDLRKYAAHGLPPRHELLELSERMRGFERPVLVVWASEDRIMPREHGTRLAELFPDARLVEIADSYTLIPEDQPELLAQAIRSFLSGDERPVSEHDGALTRAVSP
jgi:pimeloyl-ACP methyl ester carboxylesterase